MEQKLIVNIERLERLNQGYNFLNIDEKQQKKQKYYIDVYLDVEQNLKEKTEIIRVKTNLPFIDYWESRELEGIDFLNRLDNFSKMPLFKIKKTSNRKNKDNYDRDLSNLKDKFRKQTIIFSDNEINISELAEKKLKEIDLDFKAEVKKFLNQQQVADKYKQKLLDRFVYLKEKILTLKTFLEKASNYGYDNKKDNTLKIMITPQEYNQNLKEIEKEMTKIAKEFDLELSDFDYLIIEQKVDFTKWFEVSEDKLRENYDYYCDDKDEVSFEEYTQQMYDECGGVIEVQNKEGY